MITIEAGLAEITIDNKKECAIYHTTYASDKYGSTEAEEFKTRNFYEYGHIFIETENKRYCLKAVLDVDDWMIELSLYMHRHRNEKNIVVNMSELMESPDGEYYIFGFDECCVERI